MKIVKVVSMFVGLLLLSGCSFGNTNTTEYYQPLLYINGQLLQYTGETAADKDVEVGELIGTIQQKLDADKRPKDTLTSNYLQVGTEIYAVEGHTEMVLAKKGNGEYQIFSMPQYGS